jgi:hypothetical protein
MLGRLDGSIVCFRVYLEQPALALKLTEPALQLLVVHVLKGIKQFSASHGLVLLYPSQQFGLSTSFHAFLAFLCPVPFELHCDALAGPGLVNELLGGIWILLVLVL